ncbi:hypothetical protein [Paludisphaera mucosa]|uniref:Uncharacterized protein n=1 Tax=Paludisphaera mucosa TaxID=3030827 RepID=A0ABT6FLP4_9BACT|nr:hypothetical protein [Paludisphaera mucosa]MDG3008454.1 hypothetical protein [Paludisphaera mucosa]
MKLQLTDKCGRVLAEFEAHDGPTLRWGLNPAIDAVGQEPGPKRLEVQIWDERRGLWTGPHLPTSNDERWVEPLKSDAAAKWLWERLQFSLNLDTADPRGFKAAYGTNPTSH